VLPPPGAGVNVEPGGAPLTVQEVMGSPFGSDEVTVMQKFCPSLARTLAGAVTTGGWSAEAIRGKTARGRLNATKHDKKAAVKGEIDGVFMTHQTFRGPYPASGSSLRFSLVTSRLRPYLRIAIVCLNSPSAETPRMK
jgi:hypothetical protein